MKPRSNDMVKAPPLKELISLQGKRALVTGGASGIGKATAFRLAEAGAAVMIIDLDAEKGKQATELINSSGYQSDFLACDVSVEIDIKRAVEQTVRKLGGVDILVNNAGIFPGSALIELNTETIEKVLSVNVKGLIQICRECARVMIERQNGGNIINIASVDALHPIRNQMSVYDASKGAVLSLTRSLAKELANESIRVNAIAPGGILTEGAVNDSRGASRATLRETITRIPLKRMGTADDIARVVLFLASELSAYMTGSLVVADGGYMVS